MPQLTQAVFVNLGDAPPAPETDVVVLVDDSGSMAPFVEDVREALREFVEALPAGTRVGLASFGSRLRVFCRPTDCGEFLSDQAGRFEAESGGTALYDALGDALELFEDPLRRRALVLLTDCDEGGSQRHGAGSLLPRFVEGEVRLIVIRFGEKSEPDLDALARSSGGGSLLGATWKDVGRVLGETAAALRTSRLALRSELVRLVGGTLPPWLGFLSLDEWDRPEALASDGSHLRFPSGPARLAAARPDLESRLEKLLREQLRESSRQANGLADNDVTLLVVGWAGDEAFHRISPVVSAVYRRVAEALNITRTVHSVYVPLVGELAALSEEAQALCWAWLAAVHNYDGPPNPKAVLSCGNGNRHSVLNPQGFHAEPADIVVLQAANLLRVLVDDPATVRHVCGRPILKSVGSASLVAPTGRRIRRRAMEAAMYQVRLLADVRRPAGRVWGDEAAKDVVAWGLRAEALGGRLASVLLEGLADLRLDPTDFWPPPRGADRDEYTASLLELLENRGAALQLRRLALLLRRVRERAGELLDARRRDVAERVDDVLFRPGSGSAGSALEYLDRLRASLEEEVARLSFDLVAARHPAGMSVSPDEAARRLRHLLETRPLPEAIALRHLTLAPLAVSAAWLVLKHVPAAAVDLGPIGLAPTIAVLAGLAAAGLGWYRWRRSQRKLARAVAAYVAALEGRAFARAAQECLDRARELYGALLSFIGNSSTIAAWKPPAVRTEGLLSQQQCVAGFGEYLLDAVTKKAASEEGVAGVRNPFVVEFGDPVSDPTTTSRGERPTPDGLERVTQGRQELDGIDAAWRDRWRECLRRKRCDSLEEHLDFHSRRVELPSRLLDELTRSLTSPERSPRTIAALWRSCDEPTRDAVLAELERRSFPPIAFDERLAGTPVVFDCVAAEPALVAELKRSSPSAFRTTEERGLHPTASPDRLHRIRVAGDVGEVPLLVDWAACRRSWERLDDTARRSLLEAWVDSAKAGTWVDPATGAVLLSSSEERRDAGPAEETLI